MKILHVTNWLPESHAIAGGAEAVCLNTILMAQRAGHECRVFCLPPDFPSPHPFPLIAADTIFNHIPKRFLQPIDFIRTLWRPVDRYAAASLRRVLQTWRPDIVHFHKFERLGYSLIEAAARWGAPTLWSVYDYLALCPKEGHLQHKEGYYCRAGQGERCYDCYHPGRRFPSVQKALWRRRRALIHHYLRQLNRIVVLSERCRAILAEHDVPEEKLSVIHQAFPVRQTQPADPHQAQPYRIFFAGWLAPNKGLHVLLEALPYVLSACPQAHLVALGLPAPSHPEYYALLENTISRLGLQQHVQILGRLSRAEFLQHLHQAAVVVVPEQWENMSPVIIVEAMALGLPIVASRIGGIPEFLGEGEAGLLADPHRPEDFATQIINVLTNPQEAMRLRRQSRQKALLLFEEEIVGQQLLQLYEQLADEHSTLVKRSHRIV